VSDSRLLVPVSASGTLRQTVEYAVQTALEGERAATIRFVYVDSVERSPDFGDEHADADALLDRVTVWAREDAGESDIGVETTSLGGDQYVFSPSDVARLLVDDARASDTGRVVLDPEYDPGIGAPLVRPLESELGGFEGVSVETAPVQTQARRAPLLERTSLSQVVVLFVLSFGFYQVLAGNFSWITASPANWAAEIYWFDMITGAVSASVVAVGLSRVALGRDLNRRTPRRLLRGAVYVPYLLWEIVKTNVLVAAVILHPRLPVEPRLTRIRPAVWGGLPITVLANSITLTPGTLTVRVRGRELLVHTLVPAAREDLFDGGLERAVRFVFYGRGAMRLPGLRERGEAELVATDGSGQQTTGSGPTGPDSAPDGGEQVGDVETGSPVSDTGGETDTGGEQG
jgi:multicomponent Na+:H+ antiporter subunit E